MSKDRKWKILIVMRPLIFSHDHIVNVNLGNAQLKRLLQKAHSFLRGEKTASSIVCSRRGSRGMVIGNCFFFFCGLFDKSHIYLVNFNTPTAQRDLVVLDIYTCRQQWFTALFRRNKGEPRTRTRPVQSSRRLLDRKTRESHLSHRDFLFIDLTCSD